MCKESYFSKKQGFLKNFKTIFRQQSFYNIASKIKSFPKVNTSLLNKNFSTKLFSKINISILNKISSIKVFPKIKTSLLNKSFSVKAFSIIELLVVVAIMMLVTGGTIKALLPHALKVQNLIHSQMSEGGLRELLSGLNTQACTQTFSGKNIGDSIDQIKDSNGIPIFDKSSNDIFQRNLKVIKMKSSAIKKACNIIIANAGGDCPAGCSDPASFPGNCAGGTSTATKGYADIEIYFKRPGTSFEQEDDALNCNSSDQRGCYKQSCILKLGGTPTPTGVSGTAISSCEVKNCLGGAGGGGSGGEPDCYKVTKTGESPNEVTLIGCGTTQDITTKQTTAYGFNAGSASAGQGSTFIGYGAGSLSVGTNNTFLGYVAGSKNTTGKNNTFLGGSSGYNNTTGLFNTFVGFHSGYSNTTGRFNTFVGYLSGAKNTTGDRNTFLGYLSGSKNTTGGSNIFLGSYTGYNNTTGYNNIFLGYFSGYKNAIGGSNIFLGSYTGYNNTTGSGNILLGNYTGFSNTTGHHNTFLGINSGYKNTTGHHNTFLGINSGYNNTTGHSNILLGNYTGSKNTTGHSNTFVGYLSGHENTTGHSNTFVGYSSGPENTTGHGNIVLGYNAGNLTSYKTTSNKFIVGNNTKKDWIVGDINTTTFKVNGSQVDYASSSRTLKKNIKSFKKYDKALDDILKTPLFTFEFKNNHPEKNRMGIISEELPKNLQIKENPILPDLPSIRGTLWAGIKALHKKLMDFKAHIESQITSLADKINSQIEALTIKLVKKMSLLEKQIESLNKEQTKIKNNFQTKLNLSEKKLIKNKKELMDTKTAMKEFKNNLEISLKLLNKKLTENEKKLSKMNRKLAQIELELNMTKEKLKQQQVKPSFKNQEP